MPQLFVKVRNITKAPTRFIIHAYNERISALESRLYVAHIAQLDPSFVTEVASPMPIEPAVIWESSSEVDLDYDMSTLYWYVPRDRRIRFHVLSFKWGNVTLLKRDGIV
jgi:hypothetical protein